MRVVILTSVRRGLPCRALPLLLASRAVDVAGIILARHPARPGRSMIVRKARKTLRIGPFGALNGLRLRRWYDDSETEDLGVLAARSGVAVTDVPYVNSDEARAAIRAAQAELGLSLGNGYIAESVFSIPRYGMINVHGELLPEFRGAQSVIWPIHEGRTETGFSIHQIDRHIDTGAILLQKRFPIEFHARLRDTVLATTRRLREEVPPALVHVCENYHALRAEAQPQGRGSSFTTPSIRQFARMVRNNRRLYERVARDAEARA